MGAGNEWRYIEHSNSSNLRELGEDCSELSLLLRLWLKSTWRQSLFKNYT